MVETVKPTLATDKKLYDQNKREISDILRGRGHLKRSVTNIMNRLKDLCDSSNLNKSLYDQQKTKIDQFLVKIKEFNDVLIGLYRSLDFSDEFVEIELDDQDDYFFSTDHALNKIEVPFIAVSGNDSQDLNKSFKEVMSNINMSETRPPPLQCGTFEGGAGDSLAFKAFLYQFQNVIGCKKNLADSSKLAYLRGYLRGYALKIIQHLSLEDSNYEVAMKLLKNEFMDIEFIIDEFFKKLINDKPIFDQSYRECKIYLNDTRSYLYELKSFSYDFLDKNTPGYKLMSHIIFSKLPIALRKEIIRKYASNYPTLDNIFDSYNELIRIITKSHPYSFNKSSKGNQLKIDSNKSNSKLETGALSNFSTDSSNKSSTFVCKLCSLQGHRMWKCPKYPTYSDRIKRCQEINLCSFCSSSKHSKNDCLGKEGKLSFECFKCKSKCHITALCKKEVDNENTNSTSNNLLINYNNEYVKNYLLPTITIKVGRGDKSVFVRCLVDTGSQRSYISDKVIKGLCLSSKSLSSVQYDIKTYLGTGLRKLKETMLEVYLSDEKLELPLLIDSNIHLQFVVSELNIAVKNLVNKGFNLADSGFNAKKDNSNIELSGLIGVDILQFFKQFHMTRCMNGTAFVTNKGIIPFGNVNHFLLNSQISRAYNNDMQSFVNFVIEPRKSYPSPLPHIYENSDVEQGVDQLFKLESIGISPDDEEISKEDKSRIKKFKDTIELRNNRYYVDLPWLENKIKDVPSNHEIALRVLHRVVSSLKNKKLINIYSNVFKQQLKDGIIEKINVKPEDYYKHIWIPHRPIIKTEQQVTTKVRPVFNCSLKVGSTPSINEAAFTGIDLMSPLLSLLLKFRTNKYTLISDIKQAFLQIKIKTEEDRNRFSFFWIDDDDQLVMYRYASIVFGFTSSPFILNYVIKHHISKYNQDLFSKILQENFYVDNLIVTTDDPKMLFQFYDEANSRMEEGGFVLRSWNSNFVKLQKKMKLDKKFVEHHSEEERLLGYSVNIAADSMKLSDFKLNKLSNTKRQVLSQVSKVFDPLGFFTPVTLRGRLLMRSLWLSKIEWDERISNEQVSLWLSLFGDLEKLKDISIPRCGYVSSTAENNLVVFCDAAKSSYGFLVYLLNHQSNFIFSKAKVAPLKQRSIPSLELLAVYLAFKCIFSILASYDQILFKNIYFFIDAQVVISWIVSKNFKTKQSFIKNRVSDIHQMKNEISKKYDVNILFKYINTAENPADLITRGISTNTFVNKIPFWLHGPDWLVYDPSDWPQHSLNCLSNDSKDEVLSFPTTIEPSSEDINLISIDKFSSLHKLLKVTSYVFKYANYYLKQNLVPYNKAKLYWIKLMQKQCFSREINFLLNSPNSRNIPNLVNQLCLFLDQDGVLRSKGRINKNLLYNFEVINPILLDKEHHFTYLIIMDTHVNCKHLGVQTTMNTIRLKGFWIPKSRQAVKKAISGCYQCKKYNSFSFRYPKMTNMSKDRMNFVHPFQHVGIDFTGHLFVKNDTGIEEKMYILIYTCLNIRAVHIDLLPDMSALSVCLSFQRFCNIYSIPKKLYSDNAKSFIKTGDLLFESLSSDIFKDHLIRNNIQHIKIPLFSAWVGSMWERLIRTVKSCLYKTIHRSKTNYFQLLTILSNIKNVINSRPLTYTSSNEELEVISPNSFLKPFGNANLVYYSDETSTVLDPVDHGDLINTLNVQKEMFDHFKEKWNETYLLSLREQSRDLYQSCWTNRVKIGDVVLVKSPIKTRPFWLLGRIMDVVVGGDGKIRSVKVRKGDGVTGQYSICHLYPLELSLIQNSSASESQSNPETEVVLNQDQIKDPEINTGAAGQKRPPRRAAIKFKQFIQDNLKNL